MSDTTNDIDALLRYLDGGASPWWADTICTLNSHVPPSSKTKMVRDAAAEIRQLRMKLAAIEAMGYEWRWTKSIDENGEQVGAWVMRREEGGA